MVVEPPLAAKQQEPEGLSRAAAEAAVHFTLDHHSGLLLFGNTLTVEYSKLGMDLAPVDPATRPFFRNIPHG